MKFIGKTKIGRFASKPDIIYPQLRLPSQCAELIGKKASLYELSGGENELTFVIRLHGQDYFTAYRGDTLPEGRSPTGATRN